MGERRHGRAGVVAKEGRVFRIVAFLYDLGVVVQEGGNVRLGTVVHEGDGRVG